VPDQKQQTTTEVRTSDLDAIADKSMVQGGGIMTAVFTLIGGIMWLRRRLSQDGLESKKDRSEGQLLDIVIKERNAAMDDAREAWAKRATDAEMIGKLSAQVESLNHLNHKTNNEVSLLRMLNEKQNQEIAALRKDLIALSDQIKSCSNCPLRRST
jgi:hypothetical protein